MRWISYTCLASTRFSRNDDTLVQVSVSHRTVCFICYCKAVSGQKSVEEWEVEGEKDAEGGKEGGRGRGREEADLYRHWYEHDYSINMLTYYLVASAMHMILHTYPDIKCLSNLQVWGHFKHVSAAIFCNKLRAVDPKCSVGVNGYHNWPNIGLGRKEGKANKTLHQNMALQYCWTTL